MAKEAPKIQVLCPHCQSSLTVEPKTGLVLHSKEKKSDYSFDDALSKMKSQKDKSDEVFQQAFVDEKDRQANLEEKFHKALESKDELEDPIRPYDLD